MDFNSRMFKMFDADVKDALKPLEEKYQLSIETGNIRYNEFEFSMKLTAAKKVPGVDIQCEQFACDCIFYGFKPEDYNREFSHGNKRFQLVGFNPKAPKNCYQIKDLDGKIYRCSVDIVKNAFNRT